MPLGFERLNERKQRPNALINFIKPLEGKDKDLAQDFLERIAAQCYPVMKANHISVMALEEYEPNLEFVGRNFNAGEVIQLCLKAPYTGHWLPFRHVQMVMMHELAHCKQMNHSKFFWQVRDSYAGHLREIWDKSYYGEGMWGKGQTLLSGRYTTDQMPQAETQDRNLCGGVYRGRGRKRKRKDGPSEKPKLSYAERQQKRIAKKFGGHGEGTALGDDFNVKNALEKGRTTSAAPKVAKSKRGRELRAAAALARFDQSKQSKIEDTVKLEVDSETDSDFDDEFGQDDQLFNAKGEQVTDTAGHGLVKVCDDEDPSDDNARREMDELRHIDQNAGLQAQSQSRPLIKPEPVSPTSLIKMEESSTESLTSESEHKNHLPVHKNNGGKHTASSVSHATSTESNPPKPKDVSTEPPTRKPRLPSKSNKPEVAASGTNKAHPQRTIREASEPASDCPICSFANDPGTATCIVCAHVLDKRKIPGTWQCQSPGCIQSEYLNAGDCGVCGVCGAPKPR